MTTQQPELPKSPLEQYDTQIKEIFTFEKLPAILAVLNSFRPPYGTWVMDDEFTTIVHVSKLEAFDDIQKKLQMFIFNKTQLPNKK